MTTEFTATDLKSLLSKEQDILGAGIIIYFFPKSGHSITVVGF